MNFRLDHAPRQNFPRSALIGLFLLIAMVIGACSPTLAEPSEIEVTYSSADSTRTLRIPEGTTVSEALRLAAIAPAALDELTPPGYTILKHGDEIRLVQIREEFSEETAQTPFEHLIVQNEMLPEGENRLVQAGQNGTKTVRYRVLFRDGFETSRTVVQESWQQTPVPEIIMVGISKPFVPEDIPGKIAYLSAGNAWVMDGNTGNRRLVVSTGKLDGYVFDLSRDHSWLLYSEKSDLPAAEQINSLFMVNLDESDAQPINLGIHNVVHFGEWVPGRELTLSYSTVEPRLSAPGWQADNNLVLATFDAQGSLLEERTLVEANTGGVYGWWGMDFSWSADGNHIAFTRPDAVGLVNLEDGSLQVLKEIVPYQTGSSWAWSSGIALTENGSILYFIDHSIPPGQTASEESPFFDLSAIVVGQPQPISLSQQAGMFSAPSLTTSEGKTILGYLNAIFPNQSRTSRYRLVTMNQDGSNRVTVFPDEVLPGLEAQIIHWSPFQNTTQSHSPATAALLYERNLWLITPSTGQVRQVTGDNLVSRLDW